ncbi:MAG: hypothetical protein Ct9H300mP16_00650 [Pseudomonadota bacterium]|nr:MAG: hypothetical protein Ct9H300mP16_00650 [Pseudomonadota bacterium]
MSAHIDTQLTGRYSIDCEISHSPGVTSRDSLWGVVRAIAGGMGSSPALPQNVEPLEGSRDGINITQMCIKDGNVHSRLKPCPVRDLQGNILVIIQDREFYRKPPEV